MSKENTQDLTDEDLTEKAAAETGKKGGAAGKQVKARVLRAGPYGKPNDVVELSATEIKSGEKSGDLCGHPASVKAALGITDEDE